MTRIRLRLDHLRRLTDPRGLIRSAIGDCPDRSTGYDALDNADALRFCALASAGADDDDLRTLAGTYFKFLGRARREDGRIHHTCSALGAWEEGRLEHSATGGPGLSACGAQAGREVDDALVQSRLARALAAVMVSELPIPLRMAAADWWPVLLSHAADVHTPRAAANWIIAIGTLHAADPGRNLRVVETLADRLVEDGYYSVRSSDWEWFEPGWTPTAACLPTGLWYAYALLGQRRLAGVARRTTEFVIDHLFEDGVLMPAGTCGCWQKHTERPLYDQLPGEAAAIVELLRTAAEVTDVDHYRGYADRAADWFNGHNIAGEGLVNRASGGCANAIRAGGLDPNQGAAATIAWLLSEAALQGESPIVAQPEALACHLVG
jgi:hypothetical protein